MKNLLILIIAVASMTTVKAQSLSTSYFEINAGTANIDDLDGWFPGTSFLYGVKTINKDNLILDVQAGIAFPSIVTGKIGTGIYFPEAKTALTVGVRPWPAHGYGQIEFYTPKERGSWTISYETSAFTVLGERFDFASMNSRTIINVGYRFRFRPRN